MTRGVRQIVRFNWPFYALAAPAFVSAALTVDYLPYTAAARLLLYAVMALSVFWILG